MTLTLILTLTFAHETQLASVYVHCEMLKKRVYDENVRCEWREFEKNRNFADEIAYLTQYVNVCKLKGVFMIKRCRGRGIESWKIEQK